eukprot:8376-Heterococcus_DN1.PRE.1
MPHLLQALMVALSLVSWHFTRCYHLLQQRYGLVVLTALRAGVNDSSVKLQLRASREAALQSAAPGHSCCMRPS